MQPLVTSPAPTLSMFSWVLVFHGLLLPPLNPLNTEIILVMKDTLCLRLHLDSMSLYSVLSRLFAFSSSCLEEYILEANLAERILAEQFHVSSSAPYGSSMFLCVSFKSRVSLTLSELNQTNLRTTKLLRIYVFTNDKCKHS